MSPPRRRPQSLCYAALYPDWAGTQPVSFFMLENLLEARAQSAFPTNSQRPDEEVNIYLAHLLTEHLTDPVPREIESGCIPLLLPPAHCKRWQSLEYYRRNGDHRLLCLGLYGRGDLRRRRFPWFGMSEVETRQRDLVAGQACYRSAVSLCRGSEKRNQTSLLQKLAEGFQEYVNILQVLARYRFGLGARLSESALDDLLARRQASTDSSTPIETGDMNDFLDQLSAYRRDPNPAARDALQRAARALGIDPAKLLSDDGEEDPGRAGQ